MSPNPGSMPVAVAYERYQQIRDRLPAISAGGESRRGASLFDTLDQYDGYLFDSFGVLNVGETAIDGAAECLNRLRELGKPFCVLTNAASYTGDVAFAKYQRLGLDIRRDEIISSRDVTLAHLHEAASDLRWAVISDGQDGFEDTDAQVYDLLDERGDWADAGGFLFLSSVRWDAELQERLVAELARHPRPLIVGNPDLVAPREDRLSLEPGLWAHDVQDRTAVVPRFFGKPYGEAFELAKAKLGSGRLAMVGDTLHTDILGGKASGVGTILVTDHGLFAQQPIEGFIEDSQIVPDWIIPTIGTI